MDTGRILDRLKDRIPFYDRLSGQFDEEAILGHAAAKYPATLTDIIVSESVKSDEVGEEFFGKIFNFVKKVAGTVVKTGLNLIGGVASTHNIQIVPAPSQKIDPRQQQRIAASATAAPPKEEKKGLSIIAIVGMIIGAVVLALIVFLFARK